MDVIQRTSVGGSNKGDPLFCRSPSLHTLGIYKMSPRETHIPRNCVKNMSMGCFPCLARFAPRINQVNPASPAF